VQAGERFDTVSPALDVQRPTLAFVAVVACVALVAAVFWPTVQSMVEIWNRSETFQHCFVVAPIAVWLVWNDRTRLAGVPARPFWPGVLAIALCGGAWLLGVLSAAQVVSQFALIGLIAAVVLTVFGLGWARILWFPLLFLVFAVPFGEAIVPVLMDWTADFTVAAVRLSGVPVYREGVHFVIPSGQWSVIEACSGIKFLIASLMAGSLYAFLMYRSPKRRALFMAASVAVPLFANWLRAYSIVMIGHLSNNRLMTNEDHIVFGWILFAAAMIAFYWIAARWREDARTESPVAHAMAHRPTRIVTGAVVAAAVTVAWPLLAHALMQPVGAAGPVPVAAPSPVAGWEPGASAAATWVPDLDGQSGSQVFNYVKGTQRVAVYVAVYRHQTQAAQVGSSANQFVRSHNPRWKQTAQGTATAGDPGDSATPHVVHSGELRSPATFEHIAIWQWYWTQDGPTSSAARTKLALARARLARVPDTALWIAVYSPVTGDRAAAEQTLREFLRDMGPSLKSAFSATVAR
jgi:exosortase A